MLPKIDTPVYEITLPISKESIKFRPFLVKEQKILLIAAQSDERIFINNNIKQVLKNCCLSKIDIDDLSSIDIEYFFLHLRARSIGEVVESKYRCENKISENETCKNLMTVNINLLDIDVDTSEYNDIIKITDKVGIKLKCPNFKTMENIEKETDLVSKTFSTIQTCIEYIFDENNFYYPKETPKAEMEEFIESLSVEQFKQIENFFNNLPKLKKKIEVKCSKCGYEHKIDLEGLQNFLD